MSRINSDMAPALDYSQEARDLWGRLGEAEADTSTNFLYISILLFRDKP